MKLFLISFIALFFFIGSTTQSFAMSKGEHMTVAILSSFGVLISASALYATARVASETEEDKSLEALFWLSAGIGSAYLAVNNFDKALDPNHESTHKQPKAMLNFDKNMKLTSVSLPAFSLTSHRQVMTKAVSITF